MALKKRCFEKLLYTTKKNEGGFAIHALQQANIKDAISQLFQDAIKLYTQNNHSYGCMVVSSASVLSQENQGLLDWMKQQRIERGQSLVKRFKQAKVEGQLLEHADPEILGQYYGLVLHGLSVSSQRWLFRTNAFANH